MQLTVFFVACLLGVALGKKNGPGQMCTRCNKARDTEEACNNQDIEGGNEKQCKDNQVCTTDVRCDGQGRLYFIKGCEKAAKITAANTLICNDDFTRCNYHCDQGDFCNLNAPPAVWESLVCYSTPTTAPTTTPEPPTTPETENVCSVEEALVACAILGDESAYQECRDALGNECAKDWLTNCIQAFCDTTLCDFFHELSTTCEAIVSLPFPKDCQEVCSAEDALNACSILNDSAYQNCLGAEGEECDPEVFQNCIAAFCEDQWCDFLFGLTADCLAAPLPVECQPTTTPEPVTTTATTTPEPTTTTPEPTTTPFEPPCTGTSSPSEMDKCQCECSCAECRPTTTPEPTTTTPEPTTTTPEPTTTTPEPTTTTPEPTTTTPEPTTTPGPTTTPEPTTTTPEPTTTTPEPTTTTPEPTTTPQPTTTTVICEDQLLDLILMVDASASIGGLNYGKVKEFLGDVINSLDIGPDAVRVGLIRFSEFDTTVLELVDSNEKEDIKNIIENLEYEAGTTATHTAIDTMVNMFQNNGRSEAVPVGILITDGQSNHRDFTARSVMAARAAISDLILIAVAVDRPEVSDAVDMNELRLIASGTGDSNILTVDQFGGLVDIVNTVAHLICEPEDITLAEDCSEVLMVGEDKVWKEYYGAYELTENTCAGDSHRVYRHVNGVWWIFFVPDFSDLPGDLGPGTYNLWAVTFNECDGFPVAVLESVTEANPSSADTNWVEHDTDSNTFIYMGAESYCF